VDIQRAAAGWPEWHIIENEVDVVGAVLMPSVVMSERNRLIRASACSASASIFSKSAIRSSALSAARSARPRA
jgi:hypothetical protein